MDTLVIAEVALAHDGSFGNAMAFIDAVASVGGNAIKFQDHFLDMNAKPPADYNLYEPRHVYWQRTGFNIYQWRELTRHARGANLTFGVSPFSKESLKRIAPLCDYIKISRQFYGTELHDLADDLNRVIYTGPGGLGLDEYNPAEHFGISDHSGTIEPALEAVRQGAEIVEVHVCWDRRQFGPDSRYSITIDELAELIEGIKACE